MSGNKMLQAILDGQRAIKEELKKDIARVDGKLTKLIKDNADAIRENGERIDNLGKQLAYLEDDAPTNDEFDALEKRVTKVEIKLSV